MKCIIDKLKKQQRLAPEEYRALLTMHDPQDVDYLMARAREVAQQQFGKGIYLRGLIELTNVCRNDCLYCGIRRSNGHVLRYTLTRDQVLASCEQGYELGFRTFVMQGGEWGEERSTWIAQRHQDPMARLRHHPLAGRASARDLCPVEGSGCRPISASPRDPQRAAV